MALSKSLLRGMGLNDEQITAILDGHTESVNAVKAERDKYKENSDKYSDVQSELESLRALKNDDWKTKYEKEHSDFEAYKTSESAKAVRTAKETAYRELLRGAGVSEKRFGSIIKVTDLDSIELDENGKLKDSETLSAGIKTEWADFITSQSTSGAQTQTPPDTSGGTTMTKEQIMKIKDAKARQQAIIDNHELFGF